MLIIFYYYFIFLLNSIHSSFKFQVGIDQVFISLQADTVLFWQRKSWMVYKGLIYGLDNLLYMSNCLKRKTQVFECSAAALLSEVWKELFLKVYISEKQLTTMQKYTSFSLWYEKHIKVGFIAFESKIYMACLCRRTQSNLTICFSDGWRIWLGSVETFSVPVKRSVKLSLKWSCVSVALLVYQKA